MGDFSGDPGGAEVEVEGEEAGDWCTGLAGGPSCLGACVCKGAGDSLGGAGEDTFRESDA